MFSINANAKGIHTSSSLTASAATGAIVVVVDGVVDDDVVVVLFAFDCLPNISDVALSASAHPIIPIMAARETQEEKLKS